MGRRGPKPKYGCGTNAAHQRHVQAGTPPCQPCKDAHAQYMSALRKKRRAAKRRAVKCAPGLGWPLEARRA